MTIYETDPNDDAYLAGIEEQFREKLYWIRLHKPGIVSPQACVVADTQEAAEKEAVEWGREKGEGWEMVELSPAAISDLEDPNERDRELPL